MQDDKDGCVLIEASLAIEPESKHPRATNLKGTMITVLRIFLIRTVSLIEL